MKKIVVVIFTLLIATSINASDDRIGYEILKCFHPSGSYKSFSMDSMPSDYSINSYAQSSKKIEHSYII